MIAPDATPPSLAAWQALPDAAVAGWVRRYEGSAALCLEATGAGSTSITWAGVRRLPTPAPT